MTNLAIMPAVLHQGMNVTSAPSWPFAAGSKMHLSVFACLLKWVLDLFATIHW